MGTGDIGSLFGNPFDPQSVEPQQDFEPIPPGKYGVFIENARLKQTKAGTGHYIELTLSVLEGSYKNRKLWDRINIQNPSQQCEEIGRRTLAALGQALGLRAIHDTAQLIGGVVIASVKVQSSPRGDQNVIRTYSSAGPAPTQAPAKHTSMDPAAATAKYQQATAEQKQPANIPVGLQEAQRPAGVPPLGPSVPPWVRKSVAIQ